MKRTDESPTSSFRPSREGLAQVLGELEAEIMEFLWSGADPPPLSARTVAEHVGKRRGVKHITVVTVLNNLWRKGLLRREKEGRAYQYEPACGREEFLARVSRDVLSGMVRLGPEVAINSFVEVLAELDPDQVERLRKKLARRKKENDQ